MSVVGYCSVTKSCPTLCEPMDYCTPVPSIISCSLLKFISIELVLLSSHLILCHPLLLLPSVLFGIRVFPSESAFHIRWPEYWSFSLSISPFNEYSEFISFRTDWFDLLVLQGTLKSFFQHRIQKHQFFSTQPSLWSNSHIGT